MFLPVLLYAILASTFTIAKIALSYAKPFFLIGFRMTVAGILMLGFLYLFKRKSFIIKKEDRWLFFKASIFHIYLAFILEFWALQYLTSAKTNLIYSSTPFIVAVLAYFLLSERLSFKQFTGMLIGLSSLIPILATQNGTQLAGEILTVSYPEFILLLAVISASYAWFIVKELLAKDYSLLMINGVSMLTGGIFAFFTSFAIEGFTTTSIYDFWPFLFWTMLLVLVANVIVYNFYGWLLKKYSITFVTSAGFFCPIFGAFFGWFFLGEQITWHYFLALALVALGLHVFYKEEKKQKRNNGR